MIGFILPLWLIFRIIGFNETYNSKYISHNGSMKPIILNISHNGSMKPIILNISHNGSMKPNDSKYISHNVEL
jgi:hypothetical protein